jgi:hypothetical protein
VVLANLGSESETCVGSRVHLVGASISFEENLYWLPFTPPPLSCSSIRSFNVRAAEVAWLGGEVGAEQNGRRLVVHGS